MNAKFAILSTTIAIIAASSTVQAAYAGDRPGARFTFAPTVYKLEEARLPAGYGAPAPSNHSVSHGSMPSGRSMLGIDPTMLAARPAPRPAPRVAPIATTNVAASPSWTNLVPNLNPFAPVANKGQFGSPLNVPPVVASLPPQAAKAQPKSIAPASSNTNLSGKINPRRSSTAVAARLAKPARALAARQGAPIQSYGNNFGYTAGSTAPTGSGASTTVHGDVYGRVLFKSTKH
jgi:hypothetical protein